MKILKLALFACLLLSAQLARASGYPEAQFKYFAIGDGMKKPGVYPMPNEKGIPILEAMRLGGGALDGDAVHTLLANLRKVQVLRMIHGKQCAITVDVSKKGKDRGFVVLPGDIIVVPWFM